MKTVEAGQPLPLLRPVRVVSRSLAPGPFHGWHVYPGRVMLRLPLNWVLSFEPSGWFLFRQPQR